MSAREARGFTDTETQREGQDTEADDKDVFKGQDAPGKLRNAGRMAPSARVRSGGEVARCPGEKVGGFWGGLRDKAQGGQEGGAREEGADSGWANTALQLQVAGAAEEVRPRQRRVQATVPGQGAATLEVGTEGGGGPSEQQGVQGGLEGGTVIVEGFKGGEPWDRGRGEGVNGRRQWDGGRGGEGEKGREGKPQSRREGGRDLASGGARGSRVGNRAVPMPMGPGTGVTGSGGRLGDVKEAAALGQVKPGISVVKESDGTLTGLLDGKLPTVLDSLVKGKGNRRSELTAKRGRRGGGTRRGTVIGGLVLEVDTQD